MQKGKFGFRTWLYPFIALWSVLVGPEWLPFLILGFVLVTEGDPWTSRQCFRVILFHFYWLFYHTVVDLILAIPVLGLVLALPVAVINFILYIILLVVALALGLGQLKRGKDLAIPGGRVTDLAYERVKTVVTNYAPQPQSYQQPQYQQNQPPQQAPQQPYQPPQPPPQYQQTPPPQYQSPQQPPQPPPTQDGFIPPPPPPPTPGSGQQ